MPEDHCCDMMREAMDGWRPCHIHKYAHDCPDALVAMANGRYGIIIHDGGLSVMTISFCPWCGTSLPGENRPEILP